MNDALITVLLVENDPVDAGLIQTALTGAGQRLFHIEWVICLADALARLRQGGVEVILLDLLLPDDQGIDAFDQIFKEAPKALILVLSGASDEEVARQAVERGAQDYFVKTHVDAHWLPRALNYVIERKAFRESLRISEVRFRAMSDASPLGIFVSDIQGNCIYTNAAYHKISGLSFEQTLGTNWSMAVHVEDRQRVLSDWNAAAATQSPFQAEARFLREDGSIAWTRLNAAVMRDGLVSYGHVQTVEDITERKLTESILHQAEDALFEEKERAQVTLNSIGDGVLTADIHGNVTYLNLVAERMTGWGREEAFGQPLTMIFKIVDDKTRQRVAPPVQRAMNENCSLGLATDCVLIRRDGFELAIEDSTAPIHNRDGSIDGAVIVFHDVSESRVIAQKMTHLAQFDFLTDLPNRALLEERVNRAIDLAHRHKKRVGLLFMDLDYFKNINDSLGHGIGDQLLQSVASRLMECVRATDTVCRQGGDEFVILLAEIEQPQDAVFVTEKVLAAFEKPYQISGNELNVTLSIGISIYPDDGLTVEAMMLNADTAMYHAKQRGRNNYLAFDAGMKIQTIEKMPQVIKSGSALP